MNIGIIHLTDLHIGSSNNQYSGKISEIVKAIKGDLLDVAVIYLVVTGDVVNRGSGFKEAEVFLDKLKNSLARFFNGIDVKYIIVPGNHDCNFTQSNQVRDIIVNSIQTTQLSDNSVIESCLKVQDDFWRFYEKITKTCPFNRLAYQIKDTINEKTICFNCYNTAWMSSINEEVGKMYFPIEQIPLTLSMEDGDLIVSIFHHPLSWFTPNTELNNRKEFSKFLNESSHILIYGHEHDDEHSKVEDLKTKTETVYIAGRAFQNEIDRTSGFQVINIDVNTKQGKVISYKWQKDKYTNLDELLLEYDRKKTSKKFNLKRTYLEVLDNLNLPLK
ncbi:metallophosphoesterase family protein, partial [Bacteroides thetaiotaomicron]|uniref:metallophosphoesterase family protein n=5 Tax=Bacteroides TaxID=816 RepID=UPI0023309A3C